MNPTNKKIQKKYDTLPVFSLSFNEVLNCPLCKAKAEKRVRLPISAYRFGGYQIKLPLKGVHLVECSNCGLCYKDMVPTSAALGCLFEDGAKAVWTDKRIAFTTEREYLATYLKEGDGTLIDIGSSDGALLRAMDSITTIRSALDVYFDPKCQASITGEYLIGFIEDRNLIISKKYNVATAFDVFEHFYDPDAVACNLRRLITDGGIVFGETGNSSTVKTPSSWWYVHLVEHHIFWNRKALEYFCKKYDFKIDFLSLNAHKGRRYMSAPKRLLVLMLHVGRFTWLGNLAWRWKNLDAFMVGNPYHRDHMIFALRKL